MKLSKLRIQNLRVFLDETLNFDDFNCFVGPNGSGKSTVLFALNILFRETENTPTDVVNLTKEDFYNKVTNNPIIITATFTGLNKEAQEDFADYYRQGELIISCIAEFNSATNNAEVKQHGQRKGMDEFRTFFAKEADGAKVVELKELYGSYKEKYTDLPNPGTKQQMKDSLREYEKNHPEKCKDILSSDEFYGFTKGINRLSKYIQWIYVPAVKDILSEQQETRNTALGKLLSRTVRARINFEEKVKELHNGVLNKYEELLKQNQHVLSTISSNLRNKLQSWAHPGAMVRLEWKGDPDKSIRIEEPMAEIIAGEGSFEGNLSRFGHGLQRSYLFALLHELSGCEDTDGPKMILGCEEPELYQHPPQLRHLSDVLYKLSKQNSQIILCTHSPYFITGSIFENIKVFKKDNLNRSRVCNIKRDEISKLLERVNYDKISDEPDAVRVKIYQALRTSLNELFFTKVIIFVEGYEDFAYITTYLNLLGLWDKFRRYGCHIIPTDSKSHMIEPLVIAKHIDTPTFVVFDSDAHSVNGNKSKEEKHKKDNSVILSLMGYSNENPLPTETLWKDDLIMWKSELNKIVQYELGAEFEEIKNTIRANYGNPGGIEKNSLFIADILKKAWDQGSKSDSLEKLCQQLIKYAENNQ